MVKKSPNGYEVSDDGEKVTVKFNLQVGLEADGNIVTTSGSNYELPGRVPFANEEGITLIEKPSVSNRKGTPIQAESIKIIPKFDNDDGSQTITLNKSDTNDLTDPQNITIPVDTCEGNVDTTKVDKDAPYYSEYEVEVVYPYADFVAHYSDDNQEKLEVQNIATIKYQLAGQDEKNSESIATNDVGDVIQPAKLILKKVIQDSEGNNKLYTTSYFPEGDPVNGNVIYKIYKTTETGEKIPATLYQKNEDNTYTLRTSENGTVTYTPDATGQVVVYLDPGNYTVEETEYPSKTEPVEGEKTQTTGDIEEDDPDTSADDHVLTFHNKENLGKITITKKETGTDKLLDGAAFGLYEKNGTTLIESAETKDGVVVFDRLDYDETNGTTYHVKEITPPEGYLIEDDANNLMSFTITKNNLEATATVYNTPNEADVVLQKRVLNPTTGQYENVGLNNYTDFSGKFELQQLVKDEDHLNGTWQAVENYTSAFGVEQDGQKEFTLPAYEEDGKTPIKYRFKETLPEGYHATGEEDGIYYKEFDLEGCLGEGGTGSKTVTIDNTRNGSITLTKNFYTAGLNGVQQNNDGSLSASFDLYAKKGDVVEKVNTAPYTVTNNADGKSITINDLPRTYLSDTGEGAAEQPIEYYLVETSSSATDYISSEAGGVNTAEKITLNVPSVGEGGNQTETVEAYGPFNFTQEINTGTDESQKLEIVLEQSITINNVKNKIPVVVKKFDSYDYAKGQETFVPDATMIQGIQDLYPENITHADGKTEKIGVRKDDGFYYGPYTVEDQQGVQDLGTITNYSNTGAVTVKKSAMGYNGQTQPQDGATIQITGSDGTTTITKTETTANGQVTFTGLPIYGSNGKKIIYIISETAAPDKYTTSEATFTVTLKPGETVTQDTTSGQNTVDLEFINQPVTEFQVKKVYYNAWEHAFTNKEYPLPGTEIALYRWDTEDPVYPDGIYKYEAIGTTVDETGSVSFTGLAQNEKYVAIEVSIPDDAKYQYLEPQGPDGGHTYLKDAYELDDNNNLVPPKILTTEQLKDYNYVVKSPAADNDPKESTEATLKNVENWTQLRIKKFVKETRADEDKGIEIGDERLINNAEFNLYMQVLPDETVKAGQTETGAVLTFDKAANPDQYTLIGTYSSGTLYDSEGNRLDGWFGTDILKSADNVVYWLEETKAGIGAEIKPESVYTLIYRSSMNYRNDTTYTLEGSGTEVTCIGAIPYYDNTVSTGEVENNPLYDGNGEMFSTVRIAKWAGSRTSEGKKEDTFSPLGNATFTLYLTDANGTQIQLLDTLTTGLDNTTIGDYKPAGEDTDTAGDTGVGTGRQDADGTGEGTTEESTEGLTAWASSKAFSFQEICELTESLEAGIEKGIITEQKAADGTVTGYFVRVALKEDNAPNGYLAEKNIYYMYMYFSRELAGTEETTGTDGKILIKTTEIFNDAYYVQDDGTASDITNADEQSKVYQWALYPTKETEGTYEKVSVANAPDDADGQPQQYRLVNWPVDTQAVTVQKYGYDVNEAAAVEGGNLNMTSEGLDAYYGPGSSHTDRKPISVKMKLQRYVNNQWQDWAYETPAQNTDSEDNLGTGEFITNDAGYFAFPEGLQMGSYRIIEMAAEGDTAEDYELIYDGSRVGPGSGTTDTPDTPTSAAYYFKVQDDSVHITMYNPDKQDLTIKKTNMGGNIAVKDVFFTLKNEDDDALTVQGKTDDDGTVTLSNIATGTHILTENVGNSSTYTGSYFTKYFKETYSGENYNNKNDKGGNLGSLVDAGIFLGYDYGLQTDLGSGRTSVIVTKKTDISDYNVDRSSGIDLNIKNPNKVSFNIMKKDVDMNKPLSGAQFDVEYILFSATNGTEITIENGATWNSLKKM